VFIVPIPGHNAELGSFMIHRGHTSHVAKAQSFRTWGGNVLHSAELQPFRTCGGNTVHIAEWVSFLLIMLLYLSYFTYCVTGII